MPIFRFGSCADLDSLPLRGNEAVVNDSPVYPPLARGGGTVGAGGVVASDSDRRYVSSKTKKFSSLDKV